MKNKYFFFYLALCLVSCQETILEKSTEMEEKKDSLFFQLVNKMDPALDSSYTQGIACIDLNNDLYPELYVTSSSPFDPNFFYENKGGVWVKIEDKFDFDTLYRSRSCSFIDIHNNFKPVLCFTNLDSTTNILENSTIQFRDFSTMGNAWYDFDNNNFLDVYLSNFNNEENQLFTNNSGKFQERVNTTTKSKSSTLFSIFTDLNNDLKSELITCNEGANLCYGIKENMFFPMQNVLPSTNEPSITYSCSPADFNNDGLMDLFFANWYGTNELFINQGNFVFSKYMDSTNLFPKNNSEGSCWGDYDNDGFIDLFVTNDGVNNLYRNMNGQFLKEVAFEGLTDTIRNSNAVVWVDYDLDGDLDLYIANGGNQRNMIYRNSGNNNNWIKIKVEDKHSITPFGTKIKVYSGSLSMTQELSSQSGGGCGAQSPLLLHFGLGQNKIVDSIEVLWRDGTISVQKNLKVNSIRKIKQ